MNRSSSVVGVTTEFSQRFANHLRGVMRERGIKQGDVARQMGRSDGFVSGRLNGHSPPDFDMADAVAHLADIDPDDLMEELVRRFRAS